MCNLPRRPRCGDVSIKQPKLIRTPIQTLIDNTEHTLGDPFASILQCSVCLAKCSTASPFLRQFLCQACHPVPISHKGFRVLGQVSLNGARTHTSHSLSIKDGVFYCTKCGCFAEKKLVKLKEECVGPRRRTPHGDLTISAASHGFAPSKRGCD